jgi:hypothetical protein
LFLGLTLLLFMPPLLGFFLLSGSTSGLLLLQTEFFVRGPDRRQENGRCSGLFQVIMRCFWPGRSELSARCCECAGFAVEMACQ